MLARTAALVSVSLVAFASLALGCGKKSDAPAESSAASSVASSASPTAAAVAPGQLKEGAPAPDVDLTLQDGRKIKLSSLRGHFVALYFYPKDATHGCTIEADSFRDRFDDLKQAGVTVIGVSTQDATSHKEFIDKEKLPFDLAVDGDDTVAKAFGVPTTLGMHARQTFLIDKDGVLKKVWRDVTPKDHADEVLTAAKA